MTNICELRDSLREFSGGCIFGMPLLTKIRILLGGGFSSESTLDVLEDVAPSDLFEQLFLAAVCAYFVTLILISFKPVYDCKFR